MSGAQMIAMAGTPDGRERWGDEDITQLHTDLVGAMYGVLSRQLSHGSGSPRNRTAAPNAASTGSNPSHEPARELSSDSDEEDFVPSSTRPRPTTSTTPLPVRLENPFVLSLVHVVYVFVAIIQISNIIEDHAHV